MKKFKGVTKNDDVYDATLMVGLQSYHIGVYSSPVDAARAFDRKAVEVYGTEFRTNERLGLFDESMLKLIFTGYSFVPDQVYFGDGM